MGWSCGKGGIENRCSESGGEKRGKRTVRAMGGCLKETYTNKEKNGEKVQQTEGIGDC